MTESAAQPNQSSDAGFATAASPKQLMEQLMSMMGDENDSGGNPTDGDDRIGQLSAQIEALQARLDAGEGGGGAALSDDVIGAKLKDVISSVLLDSGFLEKFVKSTVDKRLQEVLRDVLPKQMAAMCEKAVSGSVQTEIDKYLGGEEMKQLLDDKFRTVTLYMKTDVIPSAIRHALKNSQPTPS